MSDPTRLEEWTRSKANHTASESLVILPVGAIEQHGPHLPLGTDTILAEHVARASVGAVVDQIPVVVAPAMPYGCSHHHLPYGGTASLQTDHLLAALRDLVASLLTSGFGGVFILNGHGGNQEVVQLVARDVALTHGRPVGAGSYFEMARPALVAAGAEGDGELPGHAGAFETAMMLAVRPELVRHSEAPRRERPAIGWPVSPSYRVARPGSFRGPDGFSDDPGAADAARGAQLLGLCVEAVTRALEQFYLDVAARDPAAPAEGASHAGR